MDGSAHFFVGQCRDHALDLPPVAEKQHIACIAATFGTRCGLEPGIVSEAIHEVRSFCKSEPAGDVGRVHARLLTPKPFPDARRSWSTSRSPCSTAGLEPSPSLCHGRRMATRTPMAGGFFLMATILVGAVWGISIGNPVKGLLIGTAIGIGIAVAVWLIDRARASR